MPAGSDEQVGQSGTAVTFETDNSALAIVADREAMNVARVMAALGQAVAVAVAMKRLTWGL